MTRGRNDLAEGSGSRVGFRKGQRQQAIGVELQSRADIPLVGSFLPLVGTASKTDGQKLACLALVVARDFMVQPNVEMV
jgi:hypothetical protein